MLKIVAELKFDGIPEATHDLETAFAQAILDTLDDLQADIKRSFDPPKSGRIYRFPGGLTHQASAPGEPPARFTGELDLSVKTKLVTRREGYVYTDEVPHAVYMEFGTRHVAPRPFMRPAAERQRPKFMRRVEEVLEAWARRHSR